MCDYGRLVSVDKRPKDEKRGIEAHALPPPYYGAVGGRVGRMMQLAMACRLW